MATRHLFHVIAAVLIGSASLQALAQEQPQERKVRISITHNENGETTHIDKEFDLNDEENIEDALRELGVLKEFNVQGDGENIVIDVRRLKDGGMLEDMSMALTMDDEESVLAWAGREPQAYLGVYLGDHDGTLGKGAAKPPVKKAAMLTKVIADSPAAKAGLESGDVVVEMDGDPVESADDLVGMVADHSPGDVVKLTYYREGKKRTAKVELGEKEQGSGRMFRYFHGGDGIEAPEPPEAPHMAFEWEDFQDDGPDAMEPRGFLGVEGVDEAEGKGARITKVEEGTAAAEMGMLVGDVIQQVNGSVVSDFDDLAEHIGDLPPGEQVELAVRREGELLRMSGSLGERKLVRRHIRHGNRDRDMLLHFRGMPEEEHMALKQDMERLRKEMEQLREELRGDVVSRMRVVISSGLSKEEAALLEGKGVKGLDQELDLQAFQLFPNPGSGFFRLQFDVAERGDLEVDVHDVQGERIYHETITGFKGRYERTLDLSDRANGTYFLVISANGKALARKLVKQ